MNYEGQYIIIDLEFFKSQKRTEIFEMAAKRVYTTKYGEDIVEGDKFKRLIKPHHTPPNSILSLTHVTQKELDDSLEFCEVFQEFMNWVNKDNLETLYVSWGPRDSVVLRVDCKNNGYEREFNEMTFVDLQAYIMAQEQFKQIPSLVEIVEREFGKFEGQEHQAYDDAYNTALLLQKKLKKTKE